MTSSTWGSTCALRGARALWGCLGHLLHPRAGTESKESSLLCASASVPSPPLPESQSHLMQWQPCLGDAQSSRDTSLVSLLLKGRGCSAPQVQGWRHCARKGINVLQTLNPCKGSHLFHVPRAWLGLCLINHSFWDNMHCTQPNNSQKPYRAAGALTFLWVLLPIPFLTDGPAKPAEHPAAEASLHMLT